MVAIITLNYNQNEYTLKCIESILKSSYSNFKLLLIDNGSSSENFESLKRELPEHVDLILKRVEDNIGYVGGINYGLELAENLNPEFFLIMNNDTILDDKAINELVKTCESFNQKAIVSGKVYHYDRPNILQDVGFSFYNKKTLKSDRVGANKEDIGQYDKVAERDLLDDVFWLFHRNLYKEIGGYSTDFWFNAEQADFGLRAKKNGYKLVYTPEAKLWHKGSVSIGGRNKNPKLAYWHTQSTLIYRYKHLSKYEFIKQYFKHVLSIMRTYTKVLFNKLLGKGKMNFGYPKAKLKGLLYFNRWFFLRNKNIGKNPFT